MAHGARPEAELNSVRWTLTAAPLAVTVAVAIWTLVVSPHTRYGDNWAVYPVLIAFLGVLGLHAFLLVRGPYRGALAVYALVHLGLWVPFGLWCLMRISKDSL